VLGQRQRDPTGADREFERPAVTGEIREPLDSLRDQSRIEHARRVLVVRRRLALAEVPLVSHQSQCFSPPLLRGPL